MNPNDISPPEYGARLTSESKWYRLYYLLAVFDVLVVLVGLLLTHHLINTFNKSVGENENWVGWHAEYSELAQLARAANAPGNDVFDSHDIAGESQRMRAALRAFDQRVASLRENLRSEKSKESQEYLRQDIDLLLKNLDTVQDTMDEQTVEANEIFSSLQRGQAAEAAGRMATMDRKYKQVGEKIDQLRTQTRLIQKKNFDRQAAMTASLQKFEYVVAGLVLLMIGGATFYAYKIKRQMESNAFQKEGYIKSLRSVEAELREADRMKDEFLATVSHELRTPLTAIIGWTQLLGTAQLSGAVTGQAIKSIARAAKSQEKIVADLLDVSRIITGKLRLEVRRIEPTPAVEAAVNAVRLAAEAKSIRLECMLNQAAGPILGDPDRLQQIAWNLLSNAVKFTPKGGLIQVRLEREGSHVQLTVSDTGTGITTDFLPFVFDRFRQADNTPTRAHGGLGLGLAIVRHLVELHGGTVRASNNTDGVGASFTVELPRVSETGERRTASAERAQASTAFCLATTPENGVGYPTLDGLRLLIVEDDEETRNLLKSLFEQCGAEIQLTASASEALKALENWWPDVLVCDVGLPEEDGYSLIGKVRRLEVAHAYPHLPAIALTGFARDEDRRLALAAGFQVHLVKPIEPSKLAAVVANISGRAFDHKVEIGT